MIAPVRQTIDLLVIENVHISLGVNGIIQRGVLLFDPEKHQAESR